MPITWNFISWISTPGGILRLSEFLLWRLSGTAFVNRFNFLNKIRYKWPIKVEFDGQFYRVFDEEQEIYIARNRRLVFYWEGEKKGFWILLGSICLIEYLLSLATSLLTWGQMLASLENGSS